MASPFVHLHLHTEYSLLDGACRVDELPRRVAELGMDAVAVTDHGVMYGVVDFYKACREAGVRPLIGCEVYVAPRSRHQKEAGVDGDNHHLILLAEDEEGYRNLVRLVSLASLEGFYYKPRVDKELLASHARGLIALTSCLGGEVPKRLLREDREGARAALAEYAEIFGRGNFFVELQDHGLPEQRRVNPELVRLARELDLPLVATNDVHYLRAEDAQPHDVLVCIQTGKTVQDQNRLRYPGGQFYLKSPEEMEALFAELPEALASTAAIAERCHVELRFGELHLPHYELPAGYDAASYLRRLCYERLARRYPALAEAGRRALAALEEAREAGAGEGGFLAARVAQAARAAVEGLPREEREAWERLEYELAMIERMGYPGYFLIVSDFIEHARGRGIAVGPGRGSAAGSLVAYVLGITGIDPLRYHLIFERFLNPERVSMPDMDIDFDDRRRGEVIDYVRQRYGEDRVAQIITFGRMLARAVVRDVGRALGMPYAEVDRIARLVPAQLGMTLDQALEQSPDLRRLYEEAQAVRVLVDVARRLEGLPRHASVHAAGVVIARDPLIEMVPLQRMPDGTVVTQFPMNVLEELGLLKFDFLGLRTLSVIEDTARLVNEAAVLPDPYAVPLDDGKTYELLGRGETAGVFQLESGGMREMLRDLKPSCLEDIIAAVALYRPGPMENIPAFIKAKHEGNVRYPHPLLEPILKDTYGILVYQEQIMQVASVMAGFTLGQADILRRAVGKKKKEVLDAQREAFVAGCLRQGHPRRLAEELYDLIVKFANYGFNRCLTGDTLVPDADSGELVPIRRLYEEQRLIGVLSLGADGRLRRGQVTAVYRNGRRPVFLLQTASGRCIRATDTHRFLTPHGWTELGRLRPGDRIAVARVLPTAASERWPKHRLVVLGYILAEGSTCHPTSFYYYSKDERELTDYLNRLECFDNTLGRVDRSKAAVAVYARRRDRTRPSEAVVWLRDLGIWGLKATEKRVPDAVFRLHPDDLAVLVGKMWVGDGCIDADRGYIYYATSSPTLARQLQHPLLRLGLTTTLHTKYCRYRNGFRAGYTVSISGYNNVARFASIVGPHLVGTAQEKLILLLRRHPFLSGSPHVGIARGTADTVPADLVHPIVRGCLAARRQAVAEVARTCRLSVRLFFRDRRKIGFRRETVAVLARALESEELTRLATSDAFWDRVVAVEPAGEEETYDLTVEGDHNFVANDFIVHNSHAAAYGFLAYVTAYLKANFPAQFMAALLTSVSDNTDKVAEYVRECARMGLEVLLPHVNESEAGFTVRGSSIRFGLAAVKNVGLAAVESILAARAEGGPFRSLADFLRRVDSRVVNRRAVESLVKAGALDGLGGHRGRLLAALDSPAYQHLAGAGNGRGGRNGADAAAGQVSLFDLGLEAPAPAEPADPPLPEAEEPSLQRRLAMEKEVLGIYLSGNPLAGAEDDLRRLRTHPVSALVGLTEGTSVRLGGVLTGLRLTRTRGGERMGFARLEDGSGGVEVVLFPRVLAACEPALGEEGAVVVGGRVSWRDEQVTVVAEEVTPLAAAVERARGGGALVLRLADGADRALLQAVREALAASPGFVPVYLHLPRERRTILADRSLWVDGGPEVLARLQAILGAEAVRWYNALPRSAMSMTDAEAAGAER